ncbi:hypothetical protein V7O66_03385 [Methanolobus sp. ZRKC3]|uniref:hypothetical protein n=1 Tax=Methanolobus sp. ZRKC3 TaxID=3125786 RepID=UPI00324EC6A7
MGLLKKGENENVLLIGKGCKSLEVKKLTKVGNFLNDSLVDKEYAVLHDPIELKLSSTKKMMCYLVDKEKGVTVEISKDASVLDLKTSPTLLSKVVDTSLLEEAFGLKPTTRSLIMAFIFGGILGLLF